MQDTEQLRRALGEIVAGLSADARLVWDEIEEGAARSARGEDVTPEPPAEFGNLPQSERDALLRALQLSERLHAAQGAEDEGMVALMHQAAAVITRAQEMEPSIGDNATLGEAVAALKRHGINPDISPELAEMVLKVPAAQPAEEVRTVPAYYPDFTDANMIREWDGTPQAESWAQLMDYRDECLSASVGHLAGMGIENTDYQGLIAFLWNIDEEEASEIVRQRQEGEG